MRLLGDRPWGEKCSYDELVAGTGGDLEDTSSKFWSETISVFLFKLLGYETPDLFYVNMEYFQCPRV